MFKVKNLAIFFLVLINFGLVHAIRPFMVLTPQKTGTWLLFKCIEQLCDYKFQNLAYLAYPENDVDPLVESPEEFYEHFLGICDNEHFGFAHFERKDFEQIKWAIKKSPHMKMIILIRDPRDVAISSLHYHIMEKHLLQGRDFPPDVENKVKNMNREDQLEFVITHVLNRNHALDNLMMYCRGFVPLSVRFENLVGPDGGGFRSQQKKEIRRVARYIDVELTEDKLDQIAFGLFGGKSVDSKKGTFRKGKIGQWKEYFTPRHKEIFKERYGKMLIELGYEVDNNW